MSGDSGRRSGTRRPLVLLAVIVATAGLFAAIVALRPAGQAPSPSRNVALPAAASDPNAFVASDPPRPLPDLRFVRGDGSAVTLADFRGRAVLLNLWATWCVPCRLEMPALARLQAALGSAEFEVVALSFDRGGTPVVEAFYREIGLRSLGIYVDPTGEASRALGVVGIPTTLLIDREGREVARKIGPADWDGRAMSGAIRRRLGLADAGEQPANGAAAQR